MFVLLGKGSRRPTAAADELTEQSRSAPEAGAVDGSPQEVMAETKAFGVGGSPDAHTFPIAVPLRGFQQISTGKLPSLLCVCAQV
jgi:hypothetical protein